MVSLILTILSLQYPYAQRVADRVCGEQVVMVDFVKNKAGMWDGEYIYLQQGLSIKDTRETIIHECCHAMFDDMPKPVLFGIPPFINQYASTSPNEDFCESYTYYRTGELTGKKARYFRSLEITP